MYATIQSPQTQIQALPTAWQDAIRHEIGGAERIRWMSFPNPAGAMLTTIPMILFAIPWTAFAVFWVVTAAGFGSETKTRPGPEEWIGYVFPLFGLPFVLIGVGMLLSPFFAWRKAKRTLHFITDKRALTMVFGRSVSITAYMPDSFSSIRKMVAGNGSGTVHFAKEEYQSKHGTRMREIGFGGVAQAELAAKYLEELRSGTKADAIQPQG
jgi:hypothetical protein